MRSTKRAILASVLAIGGSIGFGMPAARAQMSMPGGGRSLGGYGASTISSYYGGGGGGYIPYNGRASGFVPFGGGASGGMGVQPIPRRLPQTQIGGVMMGQTPIGGASLSGMGTGMGASSRGGMGMKSGMSRAGLVPFGYEGGLGMGGMSATPMVRSGGMSPKTSGPGFGWPFRMPPSLGGPSSMSMP